MRGSATSSTIGATELPNHRLQPTASSVRSYLAPASVGGSGAALGAIEHRPPKARRFGKEIRP